MTRPTQAIQGPLCAQAAGSPARSALYPGAPHEALNLRDAIAAASHARQRMLEFVDCALTGRGAS